MTSRMLTVSGCTVSGIEAYFGGGIANGATGTAKLINSTISNNSVVSGGDNYHPLTEGGGIYNVSGALTISGCTVSGNAAEYEGGGIFNDGTVTVENSSSITGNILSGYVANDAENPGVLYQDSTSTIGVLAGNPEPQPPAVALGRADNGGSPRMAGKGRRRYVNKAAAPRWGGGTKMPFASRIKERIAGATVRLSNSGGRGVLVPGGFILTAAHCVTWDHEGGMVLGDWYVERVETATGVTMLAQVYAVEPVADIAVLGGPDGQELFDDAEAFETFTEATRPVPL
jgi:hypothetical protein